ncbi:hypothetical protein C0995_009043 [Termitomyces sp. Mi166|nr:hypothetical protein C0995_009043 [Termitomyces sp. Mi166\
MPTIDCSVYIRIFNDTERTLGNCRTTVPDRDKGAWNDCKRLEIPPRQEGYLSLNETAWYTGTEGSFSFDIGWPKDPKSGLYQLQATVIDAYNGTNEIWPAVPGPQALFKLICAAHVSNKLELRDAVQPAGHPVYLQCRLTYERTKRYKWQLLEITASSAHPVRNSHFKLIVRNHTLWDYAEPERYRDKDRGSLQPNVYAYRFGSPVYSHSLLKVKVVAIDRELVGAEAYLYGTHNGNRVIESDKFTIFQHPVTVDAHVVVPVAMKHPFSLNGDIEWNMQLAESLQGTERQGEGITRLELYWVGLTLHRALRRYVPIDILRNVIPSSDVKVEARNTPWNQMKTSEVWEKFHKRYDTTYGAMHLVTQAGGAAYFGVHAQGGNFNEHLYLEDDGLKYPLVNCMDQAAMLEIACSFDRIFPLTAWIYQSPFGYVKKTRLVGIKNQDGTYIDVNNPFFGTDVKMANLYHDSPDRLPFGCHVYNGNCTPLTLDQDGIYDACSGPHLGIETLPEYLDQAIDRDTILYQVHPDILFESGTIANAWETQGITRINNNPLPFASWRSRTLPPLPEVLSRLVNTTVPNTVGPLTHVGWAHLPIWLSTTLGDAWNVQYEQVTVGEIEAHGLWIISNDNTPNSHIHVQVDVFSVTGPDGHFDVGKSTAVVKDEIGQILESVQRPCVWMSCTLPGLGGASLRYADHGGTGRIILVAGNAIMDIRGMNSYEELLPYALKLFGRTFRSDLELLNDSPPVIPALQIKGIRTETDTSGLTTLREAEAEQGIITVTGIGTRFSMIFTVSCKIAVANAGSEEHGILFDRYIIEKLDNGEGCTVEFLFIACEVGRHRVRVCVADSETLIGGNSDLEVEVVDA